MTQEPLMQAAIMGTGAVPVPAGTDAFLQGWGVAPLDSPERTLLVAGLLVNRMAQAGRESLVCGAVAPVCDAENAPYLGSRAEFFLSMMIGGKSGNLFPEFLAEAGRVGKIAAPSLLPGLLDFGTQKPALRQGIRQIGGVRMAWLAAQVPAWQWAVEADADRWEDVPLDLRITWLETHFGGQPAAILAQIQETWQGETPELRRKICAFLADFPSSEVEAFLTAALKDSRKEVREAAGESLAQFPRSQYSSKVGALLAKWIKLEKKLLRTVFSVNIPEAYAPELAELGIPEKLQWVQGGAKANWLAMLVSRSQPAHWRQILGDNLINGWSHLGGSEWKSSFLAGWAQVAARSQDPQMVDALLVDAHFAEHQGLLEPIIANLSSAGLDRVLKHFYSKGTAGFRQGGMPLLRILSQSKCAILPETASRLLPMMRALIPSTTEVYLDYAVRQLFEPIALRFPLSLADETRKGWSETHAHWPVWEKDVLKFTQTVQSRADMIKSIQA